MLVVAGASGRVIGPDGSSALVVVIADSLASIKRLDSLAGSSLPELDVTASREDRTNGVLTDFGATVGGEAGSARS